ncbi:MAG: GH1 family beta-glucosidase [Actinomycetota bacterium]
MAGQLTFPRGFLWGAATAAYQVEGCPDADGRSESIWDRFSRSHGNVAGGHTGDVACDHYHRWREDIRLMAELGLGAYRFSVSWPRVIPDGRGRINGPGLDFYDRLVDGLLENEIEPFVTLYHWDLPQVLEDGGGWPDRSTAEAFAEYAAAVAARLGDRVRHWSTINEPRVVAHLGYGTGEHAPGRASRSAELAAGHHLLLAHGLAVQAIRVAAPEARVGIVLNFEPIHPASNHPLDLETAVVHHTLSNRWFLDPVVGRGYPANGTGALGWRQGEVQEGDLGVIEAPIDFLGVNYYSRRVVQSPFLAAFDPRDLSPERATDMGWEVYPAGLAEVLEWLWHEYRLPELYVTENGAAYTDDPLDPTRDPERVRFLRDHLEMAHRALERGVPLRGYFVWSLLDNFEWALGYQQRFGIVHVDYDTLARTPRDSARYWAEVARSGSVDPGGFMDDPHAETAR